MREGGERTGAKIIEGISKKKHHTETHTQQGSPGGRMLCRNQTATGLATGAGKPIREENNSPDSTITQLHVIGAVRYYHRRRRHTCRKAAAYHGIIDSSDCPDNILVF